MKLVFATNNKHKLEEVRAILGNRIEILSLNDINCHDDIPETADTLEGNGIVPVIHPLADSGFWDAFRKILAKVFPLLITPCLCAWLVRYLAPRIYRRLLKYPDLPFYIWAVALTFAIAVTTKSIVHSTLSVGLLMLMSLISLICCAFQFAAGRMIGNRYRPRRSTGSSPELEARGKEVRKITAGQAMGQKNTVFAIWMGYTFMTPETAIVGGLYSIWHNIYNSWQLYKASRQ